jgi:hypothetical protein
MWDRAATLLAGGSLLILALACSAPEQKRQAEGEALRSWQATLLLTREALGDRKIPRGYATQVLRAAQEHERARRTRPEWQSLSPSMKQEFASAADQLASELGQPATTSAP